MSLVEQKPDNLNLANETLSMATEQQKQVVVLAATYFWIKFQRQNQLQENFETPTPEFDGSTPEVVQILREALKIEKAKHGDIGGSSVKAYSEIISEHPLRQKLFGELSDNEIKSICHSLEDMFDNQEFCAFCESWSMWDAESATEFTLNTTPDMLWLAHLNNMSWFRKIYSFAARRAIVEIVLRDLAKSSESAGSKNYRDIPLLE